MNNLHKYMHTRDNSNMSYLQCFILFNMHLINQSALKLAIKSVDWLGIVLWALL